MFAFGQHCTKFDGRGIYGHEISSKISVCKEHYEQNCYRWCLKAASTVKGFWLENNKLMVGVWAYLSRYCTMYLWARDTQSGELWHFNISLVALPTMTHLRTGSVERVGIDVKPRSTACSGSLPL